MVGPLLFLFFAPVPLLCGVGHHRQGGDAHGLHALHHLHEQHGTGVGVVVRPMVAAHVDVEIVA